MSELQEIDVYIAPNGTVKVEVRGTKGEACLTITKGLEAMLGGQVVDRTLTDEYYQASQSAGQHDWSRT